jgi:pyruvate kinase
MNRNGRKRVRTKIIATLGPASSTETELRKMVNAGLDVVRLNFSHGTHAQHTQRIERIRILNRKMRRAIKIMADLEGYRIRIGRLPRPLQLKKHTQFYLTKQPVGGDTEEVPWDYDGPLHRIKKRTHVFLDDGRIVLEVLSRDEKRVKVKVLVGGMLESRKGVNMPDVTFDLAGLTPKDQEDIEFAVSQGVDFIAQSFVRSGQDIRDVREVVGGRLPDCRFVSKVENRKALENIDEIIDESDVIMVARGDLGISVPIYRVPMIQKDIIKRCVKASKPVIVATQMLESMVDETIPTRAEVSDVANAILDGATHLMLSAETAVGRHPHRVVHMMNQIIRYTEEKSAGVP